MRFSYLGLIFYSAVHFTNSTMTVQSKLRMGVSEQIAIKLSEQKLLLLELS